MAWSIVPQAPSRIAIRWSSSCIKSDTTHLPFVGGALASAIRGNRAWRVHHPLQRLSAPRTRLQCLDPNSRINSCVKPQVAGHRPLPVAGSGSGGPGAGDGQVPVTAREIQRSEKQEEGCPSVDAVGQADQARGGREAAAGDARDPEGADVTVLPRVDQALQAGSRGSEPPPAQAFRDGGAVGCVHEDVSLWLCCRLSDHL